VIASLSLMASEAGVVVPALSTLPQGVWLTVRCAYDLHREKCPIAHDELELPRAWMRDGLPN
jgi:hypothetical protein